MHSIVDSSYYSCFLCCQTPEDDEEEDFRVLPSENLLAIGKAEEDYSSVEVHGRKHPLVSNVLKAYKVHLHSACC